MRLYQKILSASVLSVSIAAFAGSAPAPINPFTGFYAGAGIVGLGINNHVQISDANTFFRPRIDTDAHTGFTAAGGRVNVGYGLGLGRGYVGTELAYRYAPAQGGKATSPLDPDFSFLGQKATHDFALNFRGGYSVLSNTLFYALIGVHDTRFHYEFMDNNAVSHSYSDWQVGIAPGVGIELALAPHFSLDARYTYTYYGTSKKTVKESGFFGGTDYTTSRNEPSINAVSLTFNYHF